MKLAGLFEKASQSLGSARLKVSTFIIIAVFASLSLSGGILYPNPLFTTDASGVLSTYGVVDVTNPFFQKLGTNGRTCNTCHIPSSAWSITPSDVQAKFNATNGTDLSNQRWFELSQCRRLYRKSSSQRVQPSFE